MLRWYDYLSRTVRRTEWNLRSLCACLRWVEQWRNFDDWPPPGAKAQRMYLHSGGKANSSGGDGGLNSTRPKAEPADHYVYIRESCANARRRIVLRQRTTCGGSEEQAHRKAPRCAGVYARTAGGRSGCNRSGQRELFVQSSAADTDFTASWWMLRRMDSRRILRREFCGCVIGIHGEAREYFGWAKFTKSPWISGRRAMCSLRGTDCAVGNFQQQLSAVRSQSKYRRNGHRACY